MTGMGVAFSVVARINSDASIGDHRSNAMLNSAIGLSQVAETIIRSNHIKCPRAETCFNINM